MPQVSAQVWVPISPERAFAVSQTTGEVRLRWDPFIRSLRFLDGATEAGRGVRTLTHARVGPRMVSQYVSYRPPTSVGMTMVQGPWFFATFGGGWRFVPDADGCRAVWKYTYTEKRNSEGAVFLLFGGSSSKETTGHAFVEIKGGVVVNKWRG